MTVALFDIVDKLGRDEQAVALRRHRLRISDKESKSIPNLNAAIVNSLSLGLAASGFARGRTSKAAEGST
jgi:hypothetical protein